MGKEQVSMSNWHGDEALPEIEVIGTIWKADNDDIDTHTLPYEQMPNIHEINSNLSRWVVIPWMMNYCYATPL